LLFADDCTVTFLDCGCVRSFEPRVPRALAKLSKAVRENDSSTLQELVRPKRALLRLPFASGAPVLDAHSQAIAHATWVSARKFRAVFSQRVVMARKRFKLWKKISLTEQRTRLRQLARSLGLGADDGPLLLISDCLPEWVES
jgi:hypothetical protein